MESRLEETTPAAAPLDDHNGRVILQLALLVLKDGMEQAPHGGAASAIDFSIHLTPPAGVRRGHPQGWRLASSRGVGGARGRGIGYASIQPPSTSTATWPT